MKKYILTLLLVFPLLHSCIEDNGNYEYAELGDIVITGIPAEVEVLGYVDNIEVSPKITSTLEGEITADNPNYTIQYRLGFKGMGSLGGVVDGALQAWVDITPASGLDLNIPANYSSNTYICWITVTDNRNDVVTSHFFDIKVTSTTYEGWLVLCNEGTEERARLDMITKLSSTRIETIHDIAAGLPEVHHATGIGFVPLKSNPGDMLAIFSREGSYVIDRGSLESDELNEFNLNRFLMDPEETMLYEYCLAASTYDWQNRYNFAFSDAGNVYLQDRNSGGSAYGLPLNTTSAGNATEFKVAPFVGFNWTRPWVSTYAHNALFYDTDNQRFMAFLGSISTSAVQQLTVIVDPTENRLFSFSTGRDMVYMEGTRRQGGLSHAILQDDQGRRSIYGINMSGNGFVQELYIENVDAPGFGQAEHFAFHSIDPFLFYAVGNKVYLYNLVARTAKELTEISLGTLEEISMLKFNLFRNSVYTTFSEELLSEQYKLIVATYDNSAAGVNNGKVTFYKIDGATDSVSKIIGYDGFGKVVDVVYRERP